MPWVKLDDNFSMHPKILAAGGLATLVYIEGLCYCARHLTDGFIPTNAVARMIDPVLLDLAYQGAGDALMVAERLVSVGLWEPTDGGYQSLDFARYLLQDARPQTEIEKWRTAVFQRDGFTCQNCGEHDEQLEAHHIIPWFLSRSLGYEVTNGITLCKRCHRRRHCRGWKQRAREALEARAMEAKYAPMA